MHDALRAAQSCAVRLPEVMGRRARGLQQHLPQPQGSLCGGKKPQCVLWLKGDE